MLFLMIFQSFRAEHKSSIWPFAAKHVYHVIRNFSAFVDPID